MWIPVLRNKPYTGMVLPATAFLELSALECFPQHLIPKIWIWLFDRGGADQLLNQGGGVYQRSVQIHDPKPPEAFLYKWMTILHKILFIPTAFQLAIKNAKTVFSLKRCRFCAKVIQSLVYSSSLYYELIVTLDAKSYPGALYYLHYYPSHLTVAALHAPQSSWAVLTNPTGPFLKQLLSDQSALERSDFCSNPPKVNFSIINPLLVVLVTVTNQDLME